MEKIINIFWKIYYWIVVCMAFLIILLYIGMAVFTNESIYIHGKQNIFSNIYETVFTMLFYISIVGIRGFVYKKKYFSESFWIFIFFILMVETVGNFLYDYHSVTVYGSYYSLTLGLSLLHLYPLWKYSFKMNYLWSETNNG